MVYLGDYEIDDYITFGVQLHRFSSGAVYAPTGNVTYTFYENNSTSGAPTGGNLDQLNTKTGLYTARVQLTAAAGFEVGKEYLIHIEATVDAVAAAELMMFRTIEALAREGADGDTLETLSDQLDGIGSGTGAALNFAATTDNTGGAIKGVSFVGTQANTYASTAAEDGTRHAITDSGGTPDIDIVYQFNVGAGRNAAKVTFKGYVTNADTVTVQAFNGSTWDTRATITGTASTANVTRDIALLSTHTGTGTDAGIVYIRFTSSSQSAIVVYIDELLVSGVSVGMTTGYADGAVWVKAAGTAGTTPYINGTADNPCPWANALTVAAAVGLSRFRIVNGETVTLTAACESKSLIGRNWNLALGGQSVSGSYFEGATVTGIASGATSATFTDCKIGTGAAGATVPPAIFLRTGFNTPTGQAFTAASAGQYVFVDCYSLVAGSGTPYFTFSGTGSTTGVNFRRWSGGSNLTLDSNVTTTMEVVTGGGQTFTTGGGGVEVRGTCRAVTVTLSASETVQIACVTGPIGISGTATAATVNIYGVHGVVTNTSTGSTVNTLGLSRATVNAEADTAISDAGLTSTAIADAVWDEALADHNTEDTVGNVLNDLTEESGGTYRFVSGALSEAPGGGGTTYSYTNTVDDGSGNLLDGVFVQLATDSGFTNIITSTHTNASGAFTVYSDTAGTHYLRLQLAGYSFTDQTVTLA